MSAQMDVDDQFENLPSAMRMASRWLVWKSIPQPGKKPKKVPFYANGNPRSGPLDCDADYANLVTMDDALKALASGKGYAGLGFAWGKDELGNYWQGIDFDDLPKWKELEGMSFDLPGYVEKSPSGNGYHAIGYGKAFPPISSSKATDGVEAYCSSRYFTVTGEASRGDVEDISGYVTNVLIPLTKEKRSAGSSGANSDNFYREDMSNDQYRDLHEALSFLNPDDYNFWINCGIALKRFGNRGFGLWNWWSSRYGKYSQAEIKEKWSTFNPFDEGGIHYESILDAAEKAGWINPWKMGKRDKAGPTPEFSFNAGELPRDYISIEGIEDFEFNKTWLVEGLIELGKAYQFFGQWKSGKTLALMDCCANLSLGRPWAERRTEKTLVIWVASESCEDVRRRLAAWKLYHKIDKSEAMSFVIREKPIHLDEAEFAAQLAAEIEHIKSMNEGLNVVVVIDTVARSMSGKTPENGEGLMSFANNLLDYVVRPLGCACIAVHHSGHGDKTRGRGSSAFPAALDGSVMVEIERKGADTFVKVNAQEMRATSGGDSFQFLINSQPIKGIDNFGNEISEPVLTFVGGCDFEISEEGPDLGVNALLAIQVLDQLYLEYEANLKASHRPNLAPQIEAKDWKKKCDVTEANRRGRVTFPLKSRETFARARDELLDKKLIRLNGLHVYMTARDCSENEASHSDVTM
jgi:hypothetical protein